MLGAGTGLTLVLSKTRRALVRHALSMRGKNSSGGHPRAIRALPKSSVLCQGAPMIYVSRHSEGQVAFRQRLQLQGAPGVACTSEQTRPWSLGGPYDGGGAHLYPSQGPPGDQNWALVQHSASSGSFWRFPRYLTGGVPAGPLTGYAYGRESQRLVWVPGEQPGPPWARPAQQTKRRWQQIAARTAAVAVSSTGEKAAATATAVTHFRSSVGERGEAPGASTWAAKPKHQQRQRGQQQHKREEDPRQQQQAQQYEQQVLGEPRREQQTQQQMHKSLVQVQQQPLDFDQQQQQHMQESRRPQYLPCKQQNAHIRTLSEAPQAAGRRWIPVARGPPCGVLEECPEPPPRTNYQIARGPPPGAPPAKGHWRVMSFNILAESLVDEKYSKQVSRRRSPVRALVS